MLTNFLNAAKVLSIMAAGAMLVDGCSSKEIVSANYPAQSVYIAEAAVATLGPGGNGIYNITPSIPNQATRYQLDIAGGKFNVPLGVIRSGISLGGSVAVSISVDADTVAKLKAAGLFDSTVLSLPASAYSLPSTVTVGNDSTSGVFTLAIDLNFLLGDTVHKYAIGVHIADAGNKVTTQKLTTALILVDRKKVLVPSASFSSYIYSQNKTANFINLSSNGLSWSWDFGDGSPVSTATSPSHAYGASGTYTVALTVAGVGGVPAAVYSTTIVIP